MDFAARSSLVSLLAGMLFAFGLSSAQAQEVDLCGSTTLEPETGAPWTAVCSAPNDEGLSPFISVAVVTYGSDGQSFIDWHVTNHGHCQKPGDGPFKCQLRTEWDDATSAPVEGEGDYSLHFDIFVQRITMICSCFRFE